ncbi:MAG: hypothetical protein HQL13_07675 [Candidatus Omnitrophica bacterium]|nr:hypothetical protein [Candidatus Omnitrophota bacterium]
MEVLLVSCLMSLISLAVFHAFSNGLKLWARGQHVMVEGKMAMFLDRFAEDLRQTATISGIPFKGGSAKVSFPAIILGPTDPNSSRASEMTGPQIGAVQYTFEPYDHKIYRSQAVYGLALKGLWPKGVEVADLVEDIEFRYYFKADKGLTVKGLTDEGLPMGIMVDVQFLVDGQTRHMRRFLVIPVGGAL